MAAKAAAVDKVANIDSLSGNELKTIGKEYMNNPALQAKYPSVTAYQEAVATTSGRNKIINEGLLGDIKSKIMEYVPTSLGELNPLGENFDWKKAVGSLGIYKAVEAVLGNPGDVEDQIMDRGEGLDLAAIRTEVQEAFKDETGAKLKALQTKYPYLGRKDTKDFAMGGRAGFAEGGGIMDLFDGITFRRWRWWR